MTARWLVDENLPSCLVVALRAQGDDVLDVAASQHRGKPDGDLWALAADQSRIVVTRDLGFLTGARGNGPPGIVLVRVPDNWRADSIGALVSASLAELTEDALDGYITVIEPGGLRQRPLADVWPH